MSDNKTSNGSISMTGYKVEIRTSYPDPQRIGELIIDGNWRTVPFKMLNESTGGIPTGYFDELLAENNLMGYTQAQAFRWRVMADAEAQRVMGSLCLQTRLKQYRLLTQREITEKEALEPLDSRGKTLEETETEEGTVT